MRLSRNTDINYFVVFVFAIHCALYGAIGLEYVGIQMPYLRPAICSFYLLLVPGYALQKALNVSNIGKTTEILLSVGLSISSLMFIGLCANICLPLVGVSRPLSTIVLLPAITLFVIVASLAYCYRNFQNSDGPSIKSPKSPLKYFSIPYLSLCILPALAVIGTYLLNTKQNNLLLLLLVILIPIVVYLLIKYNSQVKGLYPAYIYSLSLAILFHKSLISMYLTGFDIHLEYYIAEMTQSASYWDASTALTYNAMISDTILPAVLSNVIGIDIVWVYKVIYPVIFAFVPVILYQIYRTFTDQKISLLSAVFFISYSGFYGVLLSIIKQQLAEFFFILLIFLLFFMGNYPSKRVLVIVFSASLIVSHYGTSYIYLAIVIGLYLIFKCMRKLNAKSVENFSGISPIYLLYFMSLIFIWYSYVSRSMTFNTFVDVSSHIITNIDEFLNPLARNADVLKIVGFSETLSPLHDLSKYWFQITNILIIVGFSLEIKRLKMTKENLSFVLFGGINILLIFALFAVPFASTLMGTNRVYQLALLSLSPFCIQGGIFLYNSILNHLNLNLSILKSNDADKKILLLLIIVPYLLLNTGFIYAVTNDAVPTSIALSQNEMMSSQNILALLSLNSEFIYEQEVSSVRWLSHNRNSNTDIYSDHYSHWYKLPGYGKIFPSKLLSKDVAIKTDSYIYLNNLNTQHGVLTGEYWPTSSRKVSYTFNFSDLPHTQKNMIFSNSRSTVYYGR